MRAYSAMSDSEFLEQIREAAIRNKCGPLLIQRVDSLFEMEGREAEIEKLGEELRAMEEDRDEWKERAEEAKSENVILQDRIKELEEELTAKTVKSKRQLLARKRAFEK